MTIYKNQDFIDAANALFEKRMAMFAHYTSIVPTASDKKNHLSFYLNRHNRALVQPYQNTQEFNEGDAELGGMSSYSDWLNCFGEAGEPLEANADKVQDGTDPWMGAYKYSEAQINAASQIIASLADILTQAEHEVWRLKEQGLGVGEIAEIRGVGANAVSQMLTRCERKVKAAYAALRTKNAGTDVNEG